MRETHPELYKSMNLKNGFPQLYYQFLYNVIHKDLQKIIIPFPTTSLIASKYLKSKNIKANLIYIDGSHEEFDVYSDLVNHYELLEKGGIIFGHDINRESVRNAVTKFAEEKKLKLDARPKENFWIYNKKNKKSFWQKLYQS